VALDELLVGVDAAQLQDGLRTAASTSTAMLRPATTWITTLRTGTPSTSCVNGS
jgi:hypothetical protein